MRHPSQTMRHPSQAGFTLIELIMVIVILGILAAVAVPKFTDLSGKAGEAAVDGVAGAISSGNATNVAVCAIDSTNANCVTVTNCSDGTDFLEGGLPANYSITAAPVTSGSTVTNCTLTGSEGDTANFSITGS